MGLMGSFARSPQETWRNVLERPLPVGRSGNLRCTRSHRNESGFRQRAVVGRQAGGTEALHRAWVAEDHRAVCSTYPHSVSVGDDGFIPYPSAAVER